MHAFAHWINYAQLVSENGQGPKGFFLACFTTGRGWSGHILLFSLMLIAITSIERVRIMKWQRFWSTHHLFILVFVFWSIHGAISTTNTDRSMTGTGTTTFRQYWLSGGLIYLVEIVLREVRGRHKTHISKVVQHPSNVVEVQIKKMQTAVKVGQARIPHVILFLVLIRGLAYLSLLSRNFYMAMARLSPYQRT